MKKNSNIVMVNHIKSLTSKGSKVVWSKLYGLLLVMLCLFITYLLHHNMAVLLHLLDVLGFFAPLLFLILYCFVSICCLPIVPLAFAGGAIFGLVEGSILNVIGSVLGAICNFQISRHFFGRFWSPMPGGRLDTLTKKVEHYGWKSVAVLRLTPAIPYSMVNYSFGLTAIQFSHYVFATFLFVIPNKTVITYFGHMGIRLFS